MERSPGPPVSISALLFSKRETFAKQNMHFQTRQRKYESLLFFHGKCTCCCCRKCYHAFSFSVQVRAVRKRDVIHAAGGAPCGAPMRRLPISLSAFCFFYLAIATSGSERYEVEEKERERERVGVCFCCSKTQTKRAN